MNSSSERTWMTSESMHAVYDVLGQGEFARQVTTEPVGHEEHHLQLEEQMCANCPAFTASPTHQRIVAGRSALESERRAAGHQLERRFEPAALSTNRPATDSRRARLRDWRFAHDRFRHAQLPSRMVATAREGSCTRGQPARLRCRPSARPQGRRACDRVRGNAIVRRRRAA